MSSLRKEIIGNTEPGLHTPMLTNHTPVTRPQAPSVSYIQGGAPIELPK